MVNWSRTKRCSIVAVILVALGCQRTVLDYPAGAKNTACVGGATQTCTCPSGKQSVETCAADGSGFAGCECATLLAFTQQPSTDNSAGEPFARQPTVVLEDDSGAPLPGNTALVTLAIASGGGDLLGTASMRASDGVAQFSDLKMNLSGAKVLTATSGALSTQSAPFMIDPGPPAQLTVTTQPPAMLTLATVTSAAVALQDSFGNACASATGTVTATAVGEGATVTLDTVVGTTTAVIANGTASFANLIFAASGSPTATLSFATGVASALSHPIALLRPDFMWARWKIPDSTAFCASGDCATGRAGEDGKVVLNAPHYEEPSGQAYVIDHQTGLVWYDYAATNSYANAEAFCTSGIGPGGVFAGLHWRLPTRIELASLVDFGLTPTQVKLPLAFQTRPGNTEFPYWAACTTRNPDDSCASGWSVEFAGGGAAQVSSSSYSGDVFNYTCVAQLADPLPNADGARAPAGQYATLQVSSDIVNDLETGLSWQRVPTTCANCTWQNALAHCQALALEGGGWRVPNAKELQTIVAERNVITLDLTVFTGYNEVNTPGAFWTSTPNLTDAAPPMDHAWVFDFDNLGSMTSTQMSSTSPSVRCVR